MQVVVAEHDGRVVAQCMHQAQRAERVRAAVDEITGEPELVAIGVEVAVARAVRAVRGQQPWMSPIAQRRLTAACRAWRAGRRDRRVEVRAVVGDHLVAALHGAHRRFDHGAARVAEALARLQVRLLADHAVAAHFLHLAVGVGDDPVARQQPCRDLALVADRDGVGEDEAAVARLGLLLEVGRLDVDADVVRSGFHAVVDSSGRAPPARRTARRAARCLPSG